MDWNRGPHARKFLKSTGRYLSDGVLTEGDVTFWGEWEPQSRVVERYPTRHQDLPRWLHEPSWSVPRHRAHLQNTDPLVFGDRFLYSNCRQQRNVKLRNLGPGSIIAFGSRRGDYFVLDTLLVVGATGQEYTATSAGVVAPEWIQSVVFGPLLRGHSDARWPYRAYWGVSYDDAPAGPFSFVPCVPHRPGTAGFARPVIQLPPRWLRPKLAMSALATSATRDELRALWDDIVGQVVDRDGLHLGVDLAPPPNRT